MTDEPNLFIDLSEVDVARLTALADSRGLTVDALVNEIICENLARHELSEEESTELAAMRAADANFDWDFHEALMDDTGPPQARVAAE